DRAVCDAESDGLVKVVCDKKGRILGAHIAGARAGDIIHEYVLAKGAGLKINRLSSCIHIYPTLAQTIKRAADNYYFDVLNSGTFKSLAKLMLRFLR
ncbi:MAG: hypothetical protein PHN57_06485, partial [Candidatus Omnitrophica bacterium]|nr:hypothetical protein [Candidatus Omnitrophota bacterium]